jgi:uncharacterized protein YkwD
MFFSSKTYICRLLLVFLILLSASCKEIFQDKPVAEIEQSLYHLVNSYRSAQGLNQLQWDETIARECRAHSQTMANDPTLFSHEGFEDRVANIGRALEITQAGENIAFNEGYGDPAQVTYDTWIKSASHRQNLEGDYNLTGIGVKKSSDGIYFFTQIFIKVRQ